MRAKNSIWAMFLLAFLSVFYSPVFAESFCQYASFAKATNELIGHEAIYATGPPDSDMQCGLEPAGNVSWMKDNWNLLEQIELYFDEPVYPETIRVIGDYDLCINKVWLLREGEWYLAKKGVYEKGIGSDCQLDFELGHLGFEAAGVRIQPCGWSWSAIDSVELCGSKTTFPKIELISPLQEGIIDGSQKNTVAKIRTDIVSGCEFSFSKEFEFGEGFLMETEDGFSHIMSVERPAKQETISVYYRCEGDNGKVSPYSTRHTFSFRPEDKPFVEICAWHNCLSGAASISNDDGYHETLGRVEAVCADELEERGLRGTFFLSFTDRYTEADWEIFREAYLYGHEIGGHSLSHSCRGDMPETLFREDVEKNIEHIISGVGMPREELISFAWPCGVTNARYENWLSDYYIFARGYYRNMMESKNPDNYLNYKSFNTLGFGSLPMDYYLLADIAKNHQEWVNYVYHDSCDNPEVFGYLVEKGLWVDTIGEVSKYITQRNSADIENIIEGKRGVSFDVTSPLNSRIFGRELSLSIYPGDGVLEQVLVNGEEVGFEGYEKGGREYYRFSVPSGARNNVEIIGLFPEIPYCGNEKADLWREECDDGNNISGDGCSNCRLDAEGSIYVISYVGNIDGSAERQWYHFFDRITSYYEGNKLPVAFSFFPDEMKPNDYYFSDILKRMYLAPNIELMQKGYKMDEHEKHIEGYPTEMQRYIIERGRFAYLKNMEKILGAEIDRIDFPVTYVAPYGRMSADIRRALEELGFRVNFGVYYVDELGTIAPTATLDMYQYAVSFTKDGRAGRDTEFKSPDEIIREVLEYERMDVPTVKINGRIVVPIYVHQPDFEHPTLNNKIDEGKWGDYTETIEQLNGDPRITFITPYEAWKLRHPVCIPTGISEDICNRVDDNCDGYIDEGCDWEEYLRTFPNLDYNLSYEDKGRDFGYYRHYFREGSLSGKITLFLYTIYDWAAYKLEMPKALINRVF